MCSFRNRSNSSTSSQRSYAIPSEWDWTLGFGIWDLPRIAREPRRAARHCEREAERWNLVAWMIVAIRQLRQPIELLRLILRALVDARIEIDDVHAGRAGRGEIDHHIAARIEAARIAHVGIIVGGDVDVVVLGPADAFEMDRDARAGGSGRRRHADDARFDHEVGGRERLVPGADVDLVAAAEILGD